MESAKPVMVEPSRKSDTAPGFTSAAGFRAFLRRVEAEGSWATDPEVPELLAFVRAKYLRLALKWDRDPDDAVTLAFLIMRTESAREADDPWAALTTSVARKLKAEAHADWLMVTAEQASHPSKIEHERPVRSGAYEHILDHLAAAEAPDGDDDAGWLSETLTAVLAGLGWPREVAEGCVDYVLDRLVRSGKREAAADALRRDITMLALYQLPRESWLVLLRELLGPIGRPGQVVRRGLIARLLLDEPVENLLADDDIVLALHEAAPHSGRWSS